MTNECVLIYELEPPIPFTCDNTIGIEKGAILKLTDPMTASLADGDGDVIAGIAAEEKVANDGRTKIAVYRRGIFKGLAGTAITGIGAPIDTHASTGATNEIALCAAGHDNQLGHALETVADTETFLFELMPIQRDEA